MSGMVPTLAKHVRPCVCCGELIASQAQARAYDVKVHAGQGKCHTCWRKGLAPNPMPPEPAQAPARRDMSWLKRAICVGEDPEIFFGLPKDYAAHKKAKSICAHCPVRVACVIDALDTGALHGIRGGLDETELTALYQRRRAAA